MKYLDLADCHRISSPLRSIPLATLLLLGVLSCGWGYAAPDMAPRYLTDFSTCLPASALTKGPAAQGTWRLIPYESEEIQGTLLYAASITDAPAVTLPVDAPGWHRIWLGIWQPTFAYDGLTSLRVKLSGDGAYRRIDLPASNDSQKGTYLRELFYDVADLTDRDLVFAKMNGILGRGCAIAYVKLEPLDSESVARVVADRTQTKTRNLVSTIDGVSYFHFGEYTNPEDVLDLIEPYRHSDVAKVLWAANYGDRTNFPTQVPGALFLGEHSRSAHAENWGPNDYIRGEQQAHRALRDFAEAGAVPQKIAAEHAHQMGMEFDLMFRLGILGDLGFLDLSGEGFFKQYPHCRQVLADGTVLDKASYAFDETQDFTIALMREALGQVDADGINLCFVRGPHALQYEAPVLELFQSRYNTDAREVAPDDPRLYAVRAELMNRYLAKVHGLTEEIAQERGRPLNLSVWVWPSERGVWLGGTPMAEGLDVAHWIKEGWLDSVICQEGIDPEYIALGKEHDCEFVLYTGYRGELAMSPQSVTEAYKNGVNSFAYWDMDAVQNRVDSWNWLRRIGHREEMAAWEEFNPKGQLIPLKRVNGVDVQRGLVDAVYSGG